MKEPKRILFNVHYVSNKDNKECEFSIYFTLDETFDAEKVYSTATSFMNANGLQGYPLKPFRALIGWQRLPFQNRKRLLRKKMLRNRSSCTITCTG